MKRLIANALLVCSATFLLFTGCRTTTWSEKDQSNVLDLQRGIPIDLTHIDGVTENGFYIGTRTMSFSDYVPNYHALVHKHPECRFLPVPGEHISFTTILNDHSYDRTVWEGDLVGFDSKYLWVRLKGDADPTCYWISSITNLLRWNGCLLKKMTIEKMVAENKIPFMIEIAMATPDGVKHIPLNDMKEIRISEGADPASFRIIAQDLGEEYTLLTVKQAN